jgi:Tfp pilus assembly protein PilZ
MTVDLAFECLLVCRDPGVFTPINRILRNLSISTSICLSAGRAFEQLAGGGTDLIVIDWEGETSAELLRQIWQWNRWKKPTIVAISDPNVLMAGVHVVLEKPVTDESGTESLKRAYSRMLHDHRRFARQAVTMSLIATDDSNRAIPITITNIGQGGVGLNTKATLMIGDELSFRMSLPDEKRDIFVQARVLWTREYGAVGCEFLRIPPVDLDFLHDWLKSKSLVKKPLISVSERCRTGEEME